MHQFNHETMDLMLMIIVIITTVITTIMAIKYLMIIITLTIIATIVTVIVIVMALSTLQLPPVYLILTSYSILYVVSLNFKSIKKERESPFSVYSPTLHSC
jgi:hypothetical protein